MFDILFKGECQPQQDVETVKQNMARLFKISAEKAEALFNGQSLTLKRGLEKELASKYIQAITSAGAIAYAVETGTDSATTTTAAEPAAPESAASMAEPDQTAVEQDTAAAAEQTPEPEQEPAPEQTQADEYAAVLEAELDPPGTVLLEHEIVQPPAIDTTQMSLSQPGETLVEAVDVPDADIQTNHLSLSESGTDLADK